MARPRIGTSFEIVLPSGVKGTIRAINKRTGDGRKPRDLGEAIALGAVESPLDLHALALADANVIEAVLAAMTVIEAERAKLDCRNCGAVMEVDAAAALPIAPLLEPLGDPELDPSVDRAEWHELPAPLEVARRGHIDHFRLARRTFADRLKLEDVLGGDPTGPLPLGAPLVRAMGLDALGRGEEIIVRSPIAIARALLSLDDETFSDVWDTICRAYDQQHWPPRLLAPVACPKCGARHDLEPVPRPLDWAPPRATHLAERMFPPLDEFTTRAAGITREIFAELGLPDPRGLEVIVDDEVPPCDDGGEPLLGSYTPNLNADGDVRVQSSPFVIALYYRTFRSMYEDEPYDVDAEIRETIEHELEHHLGFVEGDDPLDDEERSAIEKERRRIVGGSNATDLAAGAGWLASDFGRFIRVTWPVWLVVLLGLLIVLASDR
jgi:hypothetical protein